MGLLPMRRRPSALSLPAQGYEVTRDEELLKGLKTVVVMLADGRYVQRDALGSWPVHRNPAAC